MSASNHPCDRYSCPECVGSQCFGDGCEYNPAPYAVPNDRDDDEEDEESEEDCE